ncbi:hypothetical protein [Providencia rettgeri]|uniref:hypothetical protein n=1 Tax=Providencia rettgeri TaxID=587 RepID=UPI001BAA2527|nr:hypothetical protein [Providencia rettgeri]MBS0872149.1 hypothetical protein [Providencia rettgeri]MBS0919295.1 hypothetical protein [Providencia rettgeri]
MNALTVSIVTIMIPGVIVALIYDTYTQHKPWDTFRYILMSVVFGILTYLVMQTGITLYQLFDGIQDTKSIKWKLLSVWTIANGQEKIVISPFEILMGGMLSVPLGLVIVFISTKRILHEFLLNKGISNKYGDDNVFIRSIELMNKIDGFCYLSLHDDDWLIHGFLYLYNENDKTQEVGLQNVTVFKASTSDVLYKTNFLYISREYGKIVMFNQYIEGESNEQ